MRIDEDEVSIQNGSFLDAYEDRKEERRVSMLYIHHCVGVVPSIHSISRTTIRIHKYKHTYYTNHTNYPRSH